MSIWAESFVFNNRACEEFGIRMCSFDGGYRSGKSGSTIEFTTTSLPVNKRWFKSGNANYKEALAFEIQVCKNDFSLFDAYEIAAIERWLIRQDDYKDFMFVQDDYEDIHYNVMCNGIEYIGSGESYGLRIKFVADAPFGYGHLVSLSYEMQESTETFQLYDTSDEVGYIYPDITIYIKEDCDLKIYNNIENREFYIKNCVKGEEITIDGKMLQMRTNAGSKHELYYDSNYIFPRIANTYDTRRNTITIKGKCNLLLSYRPIRKVGV